MKLNQLKELIKEEIQTTLNEISPETFKSAIDKSNERTQQSSVDNRNLNGIDKRAQRLVKLYFRDFIGKPFADGKITEIGIIEGRILGITYESPETRPGYREGLMVEHNLYYYFKKDEWVNIKQTPMSRADARLLGKIAAFINPDTKYKNYTEFTISSDVSEAFLGMGNDSIVKDLLKKAESDQLPKSEFNQFGSITFSLPVTPNENAVYVIQLMNIVNSKPVFELTSQRSGELRGTKIKANQDDLKTLYSKFLGKAEGTQENERKYNEMMFILNRKLREVSLKNLAVGALTAASLAGSPKVQASGNDKNKIEYNQNIPAERQKEVIKSFVEFLEANHSGANENPTGVEVLIEKGEFDQVVNLFMVSEENEDIGTTQAESDVLRKNFEKIYKKFLVNNR